MDIDGSILRPVMWLNEDEITALRDGKLELDCVSMTLAKSDGSKTYSGPGYIRQNLNGKFEGRLFASGQLDMSAWFRPNETKAGELFQQKYSWKLEAVDTRGRRWFADRIWQPNAGGHVDKPGFVVEAQFHELVTEPEERYDSKYESMEMITFQKFDFPCNQSSTKTRQLAEGEATFSSTLNVAKFQACGFEFLIHNDGELIHLKTHSESAVLQSCFEQRVSEAILFALGISVSWSVIQKYQAKRLTVHVFAWESRKLPFPRPPLACRYLITVGIWELFERYLKFISDWQEVELHPLSAQLQAVWSSNRASIQVQALTACVAVESILTQFFDTKGQPGQKIVEAIMSALEHMRQWTGDRSILDRACTLIGGLKKSRAVDKLYDMVATNSVTEKNIGVWKKLRNSVAHGDWSRSENLQGLLDDFGDVLVLLYQLIFQLIGYRGKQTDWGALDWPEIEYPPLAPS